MAEEKPEGMSDQDWTNFQARYRPQTQQTPSPTGTPAPTGSQPGVPGAVDPGLKNPAPAPQTQLQPSPAPQVQLGNTQDVQARPGMVTGGGLQRTQADPTLAAGQPAPPSPQQQMQAQLRTSIMGLLNTNPNQASVTDADIAPESQAYAGAMQRQELKRRAELVHQAQRQGVAGSGGVEQRLDALSQETGQAIGANDAALVGRKLETRRQQLNTALAAAQQMGMADEANNLSRQLANLDAQIQTRGQDINREGLQLQNNLANLDASTRIYLGDLNAQMQREGYSAQERMARMDAELRRYGIDLQGRLGDLDAALRNRQIDLGYDQLGVNVGEIQARMNREAVLGAMGG